MKILYVATISRTVHAFLVPHIELLVRKGHSVDVACSMVTDEDDRLKRLGCRYFDLPFQRSPLSPRNFAAYRALKKLIKTEQYDLVHTHTPVASALVRLACRKLPGVKVYYTAHGFHFHTGAPLKNWLLYYPVERLLAPCTDLLITINAEDYERARASLRAKKVVLIPGVGLDTAAVSETRIDRAAKRAELGIPETDSVLLSVGELNGNKNHIAVLRALARLKDSSVTYVICGRGGEAARLMKYVCRHGLTDKVRLLGFRTDVLEMYQLADVFVHPSFREGLPVSLMEAMAAGLPCIVSDIRGNSDLIENGKGGLLCRPDDDAGLADAVRRLVTDRAAAAALGRHNAEAVRRFNLEAVLSDIAAVYETDGAPAKPLKILHVSYSPRFSGAENVVCQIFGLFAGDGDIEMVYACQNGHIRQALDERGIPNLPMPKLSLGHLRRAVRAFAPDIIHAHDVRATVLAALLPGRAALVSTVHVNDVSMRRFTPKTLLFALGARRARHIFWVSGSCFDQYYFKRLVAPKSSVLTNVIDRGALLERMREAPCGDPYDVVYLGRLTAQKDPLRLAAVLARAVALKPDLRAAVIGAGELEEATRAKLSELGIGGNVSQPGYMSNPYRILHDAGAMIMTSVFEGMPMVALEAMALGVPIVSTPVDGMQELVVSGRTGYLSGDDDVLAEHLVRIAGDPQLRSSLSSGALARFGEISDLTAYKDALEKVYRA